ncbi:zinc finger protein-domain-containing protein [Aspergillus californicus]
MSDNKPKLHHIGTGFCGTVWAAKDEQSTFKREDGGPHRSLTNDYNTHTLKPTSRSRHATTSSPHPTSGGMTASIDSHRTISPCNTIHAHRIPPIAEPTRRLLTERYCPKHLVFEIMKSQTNRDLIRPYLGRCRVQTTSSHSGFTAFSLRNYPLHIDQMEELGIPEQAIFEYARIMADALATMHWIGEVDGNDVEFVLAASNCNSNEITNALGPHQMWLLDFDLVRPMTMDEQGVQQAVKAFLGDDPFDPQPDESAIWEAFREQYLVTSSHCMLASGKGRAGLMNLHELFIHSVEASGVGQTTRT